jgi:hypothetical protein
MHTVRIDVPKVVPRSILSKSQKHAVIATLNRQWHSHATTVERSHDDMHDIVVVVAPGDQAAIEKSIHAALIRNAS